MFFKYIRFRMLEIFGIPYHSNTLNLFESISILLGFPNESSGHFCSPFSAFGFRIQLAEKSPATLTFSQIYSYSSIESSANLCVKNIQSLIVLQQHKHIAQKRIATKRVATNNNVKHVLFRLCLHTKRLKLVTPSYNKQYMDHNYGQHIAIC